MSFAPGKAQEYANIGVKKREEQFALERAVRPPHTREYEQFSLEWFKACNDAFCKAMMEAGYVEHIVLEEYYVPTARRHTPVSCVMTQSALGDLYK
jgi:hypothetical protein